LKVPQTTSSYRTETVTVNTRTQEALGTSVAPAQSAARPVVSVRNLGKWFYGADGDPVKAVDDVSFDLFPGNFLVLLGPSGCGKTTLLRCLAGLENPHDGSIEVNGTEVFSARKGVNVPAYQRDLSMVFQSYALWPHMTVFDNIAYPLRARKGGRARQSRKEIEASVHRLMDIVGIPKLGDRYPNQISGGQQQRVALCRALVAGSNAVLFDEPLSNVDAQVRERLRVQLLNLQRELGFAAIFVTHDRQEAMVLGHTVVVLNSGKVAQLGTPEHVYSAPSTKFVAEFMGPVNRMEGVLSAGGSGDFDVAQSDIGPITGRLGDSSIRGTESQVTAMWRPESLELNRSTPGDSLPTGQNVWAGVVQQSMFYGAYVEYLVELDNGTVMQTLTTDLNRIDPGSSVALSVSPDKVIFVGAADK
jgi:iron(III) transport system ATP-binding protein